MSPYDRATLPNVPINSIYATISAIRITMRDLDLLPASDEVSKLKQILQTRIVELEKFMSVDTAPPTDNR
jgi:hypothetical protein